jgi:UDP-glucose 4,6-dehydratase
MKHFYHPIYNLFQPYLYIIMVNILVTGGCGFIGSNLINRLIQNPNLNIVNIDRMDNTASLNNIEMPNNSRYHHIVGDICSMELIEHILEHHKIDIVIHIAAQSHVDRSISNSIQFTIDNVMGTNVLLEASRKYNNLSNSYGRLKLFFHMSTDEVYGDSIGDNPIPMTESSPLNPRNPYSATKAGAEELVRAYHITYNLPVIICRSNNVYGKNQHPEKLIPRFINLLKNNKKCTVHGNGNMLRSFIHVNDCCDAIDLIISKGKIGSVYNISSRDEISVINIAKILIQKIKPNEPVENWIEFVEDRSANDQRYLISNDRLNSLGFVQKINLIDGLDQTIQFYMELNIESHWSSFNSF